MRSLPRTAVCLAVVCCLNVAQTKRIEVQSHHLELTAEGNEWVEDTLKQLSLEEKVGQMLQVRYFGDYASLNGAEYRAVRDQLKRYNIGSVVLGLHFDASGPIRNSPRLAAEIANQLQRDSKLPLLMAADLERGAASRFTDVPDFPWPMAFGAIGDPAEVERFGAITAKEARAVGIHWALAPVADINSNPANPIINMRAFGDDPEQVSVLVSAFIRGAHQNGMLVSAKHFPGEGDTAVDSHHGLPVIAGSKEQLQRIEFQPFKRAIDAGADSILLVHARVPALEPDPSKISTVSPAIVNGILKGELGFKGVVITDAMEMSAVSAMYGSRAAVEAVKAGNDVIALPQNLDGAFRSIVEAVRKGEIAESRIDESVRKILRMKASVGLHQSRLVDVEQAAKVLSDPDDVKFAQHIADEAITLIRDNGRLLPLEKFASSAAKISTASLAPAAVGPGRHRVVLILITESVVSSSGREFERAFKLRSGDATTIFVDEGVANQLSASVLKAVNDADKVVIAAYVYHTAARQTVVNGKLVSIFGLVGSTGDLVRQVLKMAAPKTIVVAVGSPYLIENFPEIQTYICSYAPTPASEVAVVKSLFGETQGHGKLPVALPTTAPRGFSLLWPAKQMKP